MHRRDLELGLAALLRSASILGLFALAACTGGASSAAVDNGSDVPAGALASAVASADGSTIPTSSTQVSTDTALSSTTAPPRQPITVGIAGDTSFTDGLDQRDPFGQVLEVLREPDLMIVNLETVVADPDVGRPPVAKTFLFKSPPASLDLLVDAGVDVVGLANNHTLDFGPDGVAQTLKEIDDVGLHRVGAGIDQDDAYTPLVVDVGDWRIGVVSLSRVPCDWSASGENVRPQVAWACPPFIELADAMVLATVARADVTVVMVHGGEEGELCPSEFMTDLEAHWAELGVDAVVDGHPHVLQGVTSIGDTMVVHSTGNFAFPSAGGITANSAVFLLDLAEDGLTLRVEPLRADGGVLSLPTEAQRAEILAQINRGSDQWRVSDEGVVTPARDHVGIC